MPQAAHRQRAVPIRLVPIVLAVAAFLLPTVAAAAQPTKRVAKEASSATLGKTYLATLKGRTLYSLSAETKGRFICTGGCLQIWHPLLIGDGVKPKGPVKLGTIERPNGRTQVTYKGKPLYTFSGDAKQGDLNGEGIKDVGTWHVATVSKLKAPTPEPQPEPGPYPNPYPY